MTLNENEAEIMSTPTPVSSSFAPAWNLTSSLVWRGLAHDVTLEEIVPKKSILIKTVSHYHWGSIEKIDGKGRLVIKRADEKVLFYDLDTGQETQ